MEYEREAVFINTIQAMEETAIGDNQGYMPLWKFRTARYPQPAISLSTPLLTDIKREYVIWGLLLAITSMMSLEVYEMACFALLWHGELVGSILFGEIYSVLDPPGRFTVGNADLKGSPDQNTSMALTAADARGPNSTVSSANGTQARNSEISDDRLHVAFRSSGDDVGMDHLLIYILVVLAQAAVPPSDVEINRRWQPSAFGRVCRFSLVPKFRLEPPVMLFFWLIGAVAEAARYVVENDAYRSLNMLIYADGKLIGKSAFACFLPNNMDDI